MNISDVVAHLNNCDQAANYSLPKGEPPQRELLSVVFKPYPHQPNIHELQAIEILNDHGVRAHGRFITVDGGSIPKLQTEFGLDLSRMHDLGKTKSALV